MSHILAIDDDRDACELLQAGLGQHGFEVEWTTSGSEGVELADKRDFSTVITDLKLGELNGLDVCKRITREHPELPVIVLTAFGDMSSAVAAMRAGARDFINKPVGMEVLAGAIARAVEQHEVRAKPRRPLVEDNPLRHVGLLGRSPAMQQVCDLVQRVADSDASVLVTGESGTGKELVARAIHQASARASGAFVAINCAAMPRDLLESELFGHVRGAFTDAKASKKGLFEQANGGTLLLDEVGEMPLDMQPKLLRALQERTVRPVGSSAEVPFDTRVVASTNRELEAMVERGEFREDLYYRLNVVQIQVPPLSARGDDVLVLAQAFIERFAEKLDKSVHGITTDAAQKLLDFEWPGNVRQLENSMERAVTLTRGDRITADDLPGRIRGHRGKRLGGPAVDLEHMLTLEEVERRHIEQVLEATQGNKTRAAKVLGVDRRTLYRKLERYESASSAGG